MTGTADQAAQTNVLSTFAQAFVESPRALVGCMSALIVAFVGVIGFWQNARTKKEQYTLNLLTERITRPEIKKASTLLRKYAGENHFIRYGPYADSAAGTFGQAGVYGALKRLVLEFRRRNGV